MHYSNCIMARRGTCVFILIAVVFAVDVQSFSGYVKEEKVKQQLWAELLKSSQVIEKDSRVKFVLECTVGKRCSEDYKLKWNNNTTEYEKGRFWQAYKSYLENSPKLLPVDGDWGSWTSWSMCNASCGDISLSHRTRLCNNPVPTHKGRSCLGFKTQSQSCKGACKTDIHDAEGTTEAKAFLERIHLGFPHLESICMLDHCTFDALNVINSQQIKDKYWSSLQCYKYDKACPVDGGWASWSNWTNCEPKCGEGSRWRIRNCSNPTPANAGFPCLGKYYMEEPCFGMQCSEMEFILGHHLSGWSRFGKCSVDCGKYGFKEKRRICLLPGKCTKEIGNAKDEIVIRKPCYNGECSHEGGWSTWWGYTECTANCGVGRQTRIRLCDNPLPTGSSTCVGYSINTRLCKAECNVSEAELFAGRNSTRKVQTMAHGDPYHYDLNPKLEYLYSTWSVWTDCSKTCDVGKKKRSRSCVKSGQCIGEVRQIKYCNTMKCPKTGGWSKWLSWTPCSTTCGKGLKMRYRKCDSPFPKYGGVCVGLKEESEDCSTTKCIEPLLKYGQWLEWGLCSKTCGVGSRTRSRHCIANVTSKAVNQMYLGDEGHDLCKSGSAKEEGVCNPVPCPSAGDWAHWSPWSACSSTCGMGIHYRDRTCTDPSPQYGGDFCFGPGSETSPCFHGPCFSSEEKSFVANGNNWLRYRPLSKPLRFLTLFIIFKTFKHEGTLIHRFPFCSKVICDDHVTVSLKNRRPQLKVQMNGGSLVIQSKTTVKLKHSWHSVFVYMSDNSGFMRIDNGRHYYARFDPLPKPKPNFDGIMLVGSDMKAGFSGYVAQVIVNFFDMNLYKTTQWKGYGTPVGQFEQDMEKLDPIIKYPRFTGRTYMILPVNASLTFQLKTAFFPSKLDGLLLFNMGQVAGSYFYVMITGGILKFCINCGNVSSCDNIEAIQPHQWYHLGITIQDHMASVHLNHGKAIQVTCTGKRYHAGYQLFVGGGRKVEWSIFKAIIRNKMGFVGFIYNVVINGKNYDMKLRPLLDYDGFMNSETLQIASRISTLLETSSNKIVLRCDYTWYKQTGHEASVEWLHADRVIQSSPKEVVDPRIPGIRYRSSLTLSGSKHKTGLYLCIVRHDGYITNQHAWILVRRNNTITYQDGAYEANMMPLYLLAFGVFAILVLGVVAILVVLKKSMVQKEQNKREKIAVEEDHKDESKTKKKTKKSKQDLKVSQETQDDLNESQEETEDGLNESQETQDDFDESQETQELNESQETQEELNESQETEEELNESQETDDGLNESQETGEDADESQENEDDLNESQETQDLDESQEVQEDLNESQETEDDDIHHDLMDVSDERTPLMGKRETSTEANLTDIDQYELENEEDSGGENEKLIKADDVSGYSNEAFVISEEDALNKISDAQLRKKLSFSSNAESTKSGYGGSMNFSDTKYAVDEGQGSLIKSSIKSSYLKSLPPTGSPSPPKGISVSNKSSISHQSLHKRMQQLGSNQGITSATSIPWDSCDYLPYDSDIMTPRGSGTMISHASGFRPATARSTPHVEEYESGTRTATSITRPIVDEFGSSSRTGTSRSRPHVEHGSSTATGTSRSRQHVDHGSSTATGTSRSRPHVDHGSSTATGTSRSRPHFEHGSSTATGTSRSRPHVEHGSSTATTTSRSKPHVEHGSSTATGTSSSRPHVEEYESGTRTATSMSRPHVDEYGSNARTATSRSRPYVDHGSRSRIVTSRSRPVVDQYGSSTRTATSISRPHVDEYGSETRTATSRFRQVVDEFDGSTRTATSSSRPHIEHVSSIGTATSKSRPHVEHGTISETATSMSRPLVDEYGSSTRTATSISRPHVDGHGSDTRTARSRSRPIVDVFGSSIRTATSRSRPHVEHGSSSETATSRSRPHVDEFGSGTKTATQRSRPHLDEYGSSTIGTATSRSRPHVDPGSSTRTATSRSRPHVDEFGSGTRSVASSSRPHVDAYRSISERSKDNLPSVTQQLSSHVSVDPFVEDSDDDDGDDDFLPPPPPPVDG